MLCSRFRIPSKGDRKGCWACGWGSWNVSPYSSNCWSSTAVLMFVVGVQKIGGALYSHSLDSGRALGDVIDLGMC